MNDSRGLICVSDKIGKKRYLPSIDGLRAVAIILVMLYHFQLPFAQGGFIGVDIFFVLSGYLITNSLMIEWHQAKKFDFKQFWLKRLRRLLPAVITLLVVVLIVCFFFFPSSFKKSWSDSIAALFYVSNWWYIFKKVPYFDSFGTPSPFKHLWSLAIEEQFYLLWPVALFGLLKWLKKRQRVLIAIITAGIFSAVLMAVLYDPNGIDRVYYGTDTRLFAILAGCGLAFLWPYYYLDDNFGQRAQRILDGAGSVALAALIGIALLINEYQTFLYHGGLVLVALFTIILLGVIVHPSSKLGKLFANPFFSWLGKRSYSLYLWHYPVVALLTPIKLVGRFHIGLVLMQLALIVVLANFSYMWIEEPIRKHGVQASFTSLKAISKKQLHYPAISLGMMVLLTLGVLGTNYLLTRPNTTVTKPVETKVSQAPVKKETLTQVLAIGDSIMLGIKDQLEEAVPGIVVDGKVGRQLVDAKKLVEEKYSDYNHKDAAIFIELGSNSPFNSKDLASFLKLFDKATVFLINTRVPRNWEGEVNSMLTEAVTESEQVRLIDWYSIASQAPNLLAEDGVHLSEGDGKATYVSLITNELANYELKLPEKVETSQSTSDKTENSRTKESSETVNTTTSE
nr:acyltransferase family protein [Vagococcus allomyrinae]